MSPTLSTHRAALPGTLRQGLTLSAGFHLTLAVLLFGALRLMPQPPPPIEKPPDDGPHDVIEVGEFGGPPPSPPIPAPAGPSIVIPVDDADSTRDQHLVEVAPLTGPALDGVARDGAAGLARGESHGVAEEIEPRPNDWVVHDIEPEVVRRVLPSYPDMARQAGLEGDVMVRVLVGKRGEVRRVEIEHSSPLFDEAALEAVKGWTFRPALASGNPVAVWVRIPIVFRMN